MIRRPPLPCRIICGRGLRNQKRPNEIDGENFLEFFQGIVDKRYFLLNTGIVHNNIDLAKRLDSTVNQIFHLIRFGDIGRYSQTISTGTRDLFLGTGGRFGISDIVDDHRGPFPRKPDCNCFADTGCGACHDGYFTC